MQSSYSHSDRMVFIKKKDGLLSFPGVAASYSWLPAVGKSVG